MTSRTLRLQMGWIVLFAIVLAGLSSALQSAKMKRLWSPTHIRSGAYREGMSGSREGNMITASATSKASTSCPDLLVKKNGQLLLYNTRRSEVPGVNPIRFEKLSDYRDFVAWQAKNGIKCPILYLQHTFAANGESALYSGLDPLVQKNGYLHAVASTVPQDVHARTESVYRFDREHTQLCGDQSIVHPQFCIEDKKTFDQLNRSGAVSKTSNYRVSLDGEGDGVVYSYDPMNQYIGVRTPIDEVSPASPASKPAAT